MSVFFEVFVDATPSPAAEPEPLPLPPLPLPAPTPAPAAEPPHPPVGFTLRRLCHIVVLLFSLFLVVRTTFVEPFGVTTGSMAETIHGNRRERPCPRCGHPVCVGSPDDARGGPNPQDGVTCPNCGFAKFDVSGEPETFGDRLMVDKLVYRLRSPRRWEVAVFRCPEAEARPNRTDREVSAFEAKLPLDDDRKPYVKRVVGLPGERVRIFDGDVYADGVIQRKTLQQVRETRIPVFRMDHPPHPKGWALRWEVGAVVGSPKLPRDTPPPPPAADAVVQDSTLTLDATAAPVGLTYRHRDPDTKKDDVVRDRLGYNGSKSLGHPQPAHDFLVECEVEVVSGDGGAFAVRLNDGADTVKVHLPIGVGPAIVAHEGGAEQLFDTPFALVPGQRYRLEFGFIDRRVLVAIDGKPVAAPLDLPPVAAEEGSPDPAGKRGGIDRPVQLGCRGGHVVLHHFTLWRDIHYRGDDGKHGVKAECRLGANEYFMLGDNTASSHDSREWATPGVPEHDFLGKPFLVHQPLKVATVPVLGRVQAIDWERLRLLE